MSDKLSRRDFLKVAGMGTAIATVLTGCGPTSRYVRRQPYSEMPEYTLPGRSTYFATTCGECPAGCGLIVNTREGRAHKVEGNPAHPVNHGSTCARAQAALQGLYNPDRVKGPGKQAQRGSGQFATIKWDVAVDVIKDALSAGTGTAFLMGLFPDHLFDLVQVVAAAAGGSNVLRFGTLAEFEARVTLMDAAQKVLGVSKLPFFDLEHADITFSFGANFGETWVSPVAYSRAFGQMRQGHPGQRGYLVHFEPRMSATAIAADEWIPVTPGSEALVAQVIGRLLAGDTGFNLADTAAASGVPAEDLQRLARIFGQAARKLAIPGSAALGSTNGLAAAEAILALNVTANNLGKEGGLFFMPDFPVHPELAHRPSSLAEISALVDKMKGGQIKALFIHGVNPVYGLPKKLGFAEALKNVPLVVSFASFLDETALQADYVLPDHTPFEAWGYQKVATGADRLTISGLQPVVVPLYDTRSTVDVILAAVQKAGGDLAGKASFNDEVDFLQKTVSPLKEMDGFYPAGSSAEFWSRWQQYGGWWKKAPGLAAPSPAQAAQPVAPAAQFSGSSADFNLFLMPFPHPILGDGSVANRPTLQETPDPTTTVMWNSRVEINPQTASQLGVHSDDVVKITSPVGEFEAVVYEYPGIHPGVVAIPLGYGHTALGRYAQGSGVNPLDLVDLKQNESGNLAFMATRVRVTPAGRRRPLSRYESREGIYGTKKG